MLARQKRCRRHQCHLIAAHRRHKGSPQGHLGLAKADITADQPVRGTASRQIAHHILDCAKLIICLDKAKTGTKFSIGAGRSYQRLGVRGLTLRGNADQLFCHDPHPPLDAGNTRLPGCTAKPVELCIGTGTAIARQHFDIFNRKIQLVTTGIDQLQAIMRATRGIDDNQPLIPPDPVFGMNHEITLFQRADLAQKILTAPPL